MISRWASVLLVLVGVSGSACGDSRPDIVLVTFGALRRDHVGAYGWKLPGPSPTPRLDALAESARVFEGALTTMPATAPAHASLFSGLPPREHGVLANGDVLPETLAARMLPAKLADAGYRAGAFVTSDLLDATALGLAGFDPYDARWKRSANPGPDAAAAALAWIDRALRGERRPLFVWLHLADARAPYGNAAEKLAQVPLDKKSYGWVDRARYRDKKTRVARATQYSAGVREADAALGVLLDGLAERDLEPLLLVAADHGELMAEHLDRLGFAFGHGPLLGPQVLWIPLLVAGPDVDAARVAGAASIADLYTTILESAGAGDPKAAEEGRIDLRADPPVGRTVAAARRLTGAASRKRRGVDPAAVRYIAAHAVAVSDGRALVVVGEDGKPAGSGPQPSAPLALAAADALVAQRAGEKARKLAAVGSAPAQRPRTAGPRAR
jgi:arylsulfatase A-like enzyme